MAYGINRVAYYRVRLRTVLSLLIPVIVVCTSSIAQAGEVSFKVFHHGVESKFDAAGDVDGHILGFYSRKGIALFEDGTVGSYSNRGTFDYTNGEGTYIGYNRIEFDDGSFTVAYFEGGTEINNAGGLDVRGTGKYVNGGGRYEGIKGDLKFDCGRSAGFVKAKINLTSCDVTANQILP